MNAGSAIRACQALLVAAGAVRVRHSGGHEIWHLSGRPLVIQLHPKAWRNPRAMKQFRAEVRRAQRAEPMEA